MSIVEDEYQARMAALTPKERVARAVAMFNWSREAIARRILAEKGPLPPERLKWEVALCQYGADPITRAMIERKLADVPD